MRQQWRKTYPRRPRVAGGRRGPRAPRRQHCKGKNVWGDPKTVVSGNRGALLRFSGAFFLNWDVQGALEAHLYKFLHRGGAFRKFCRGRRRPELRYCLWHNTTHRNSISVPPSWMHYPIQLGITLNPFWIQLCAFPNSNL